ncbi:hypothetical protein JX266_005146 [Neoarthrinium moseri]|uniref:uncharacterized protein n=1 Tax=Neoarthrinium moseri TaxID=1658444 RepID=UPI001FDDF529|nr:uncharacterized protein JN550_006481 [Neoarthrinium moseri]KAI1849185.1 hypothetical protein JX266_005146 [Neoarthrinium moseri]KAI1868565.1 hypothetical protein JN550_006481 [Neoarthrinium moseri]
MQDSKSDWETESLEMSKIYTYAALNISATGAPNNTSGFLNMLEKPLPMLPRAEPALLPGETCFLVDPFFWWAEVTRAPLMMRGWVFQERFLAPRVLHFGKTQMLWECATMDACELYPRGVLDCTKSDGHTDFKNLDFMMPADLKGNIEGRSVDLRHTNLTASPSDMELLHFWCDVIQAYTRTRLTEPKDKLIALAGVAQTTAELYKGLKPNSSRYVAGTFMHHFLVMLEWHSCSPQHAYTVTTATRPSQYRAPSWSWASVEGRVFFEYLPRVFSQWDNLRWHPSWGYSIADWNKKCLPDERQLRTPHRQLGWKRLVSSVTAEMVPIAGSDFGQLSDGNIRLTGLVVPVELAAKPRLPMFTYQDPPANDSNTWKGTHYLPLRCSKLADDLEKTFFWVTGLIIEAINPIDSIYRRSGLFCAPSSRAIRALGISLNKDLHKVHYSGSRQVESLQII